MRVLFFTSVSCTRGTLFFIYTFASRNDEISKVTRLESPVHTVRCHYIKVSQLFRSIFDCSGCSDYKNTSTRLHIPFYLPPSINYSDSSNHCYKSIHWNVIQAEGVSGPVEDQEESKRKIFHFVPLVFEEIEFPRKFIEYHACSLELTKFKP